MFLLASSRCGKHELGTIGTNGSRYEHKLPVLVLVASGRHFAHSLCTPIEWRLACTWRKKGSDYLDSSSDYIYSSPCHVTYYKVIFLLFLFFCFFLIFHSFIPSFIGFPLYVALMDFVWLHDIPYRDPVISAKKG